MKEGMFSIDFNIDEKLFRARITHPAGGGSMFSIIDADNARSFVKYITDKLEEMGESSD